MREPLWLDRTFVEAIHADLIQQHGGSAGIRDSGLIDSALARPRHQWTYKRKPDLAALAAAYGWGLARNHGFVDGPKRVALMATYVFLVINGQELDVPEPEAVAVMLGVADGSLSESRFATWIRRHLVRLRGRIT